MACSGCNNGRGDHNADSSVPAGCGSNGSCGTGGCNKLNVFDWLSNMTLPNGQITFDIVELRFKNSRKEFYRNVNNLSLVTGDVVAVEASPGHDIGVVSLTGELVRLQMKKKGVKTDSEDIKKIYRKAKQTDIDKWKEAQDLEVPTMYKARTFALSHGLEMKISDVEYQGDKTKAIFYYTAEARVDFRELIKTLADQFKVRIEMKQIGARQEASRLGGIGACGRELCCSTWLTDFRTVSTSAARYQQLSLNPLKLAGQCGKLKCCLNFELDSYLDAVKDFPNVDNIKLKSKKGDAFHQKTDIFKRVFYYSYFDTPDVFIGLSVEKVKEIIDLNKRGEQPDEISDRTVVNKEEKAIEPAYENVVGQDSLTRFDRNKKPNNKNRNNKNRNNRGGENKVAGDNSEAKPPVKQNVQPKPQHQNKDKVKPNPNQNKPNPNQNPNNKKPQGNNNPNRNKNNNNRNNQNNNKTDGFKKIDNNNTPK